MTDEPTFEEIWNMTPEQRDNYMKQLIALRLRECNERLDSGFKEYQDVLAKLQATTAQRDALAALVRRIIARPPTITEEVELDGGYYEHYEACVFCGKTYGGHEDDCLLTVAKALLAEMEEQGE